MGRILTLLTLWTTPHQVTGSHRVPTGSGPRHVDGPDDRVPGPPPLRGDPVGPGHHPPTNPRVIPTPRRDPVTNPHMSP